MESAELSWTPLHMLVSSKINGTPDGPTHTPALVTDATETLTARQHTAARKVDVGSPHHLLTRAYHCIAPTSAQHFIPFLSTHP